MPGLAAATVDLVFKPSEATARTAPDISAIWDGEWVFEDVPVKWPDGRPSPDDGG